MIQPYKYQIINDLFKLKVATKIDDDSGFLIIEEYCEGQQYTEAQQRDRHELTKATFGEDGNYLAI